MRDIRIIKGFIFALTSVLILAGCGDGGKKPGREDKTESREIGKFTNFNADSAYHYVDKQVSFGPRVPGTPSHKECRDYLFGKLQQYADTAIIQQFKTRLFNGEVITGYNIIASFNREQKNRLLLAAHWDSRPFADYDPDTSNYYTPIPGANDGGSGTGVLIEIARQLQMKRPVQGIDIILFDLEDYGEPSGSQYRGQSETWGLGSQYWSRNPHTINYRARFGILLDMVGASNATFLMEGYSMTYASRIVKKVWTLAGKLGYGNYFIFREGGYITDDHYYINEIAGIPTINIIHLDDRSANGSFFDQWHTLGDDMSVIDKQTLEVVGMTVINVIYNRI